MPVALLRAYAAMLPVLQAEESLRELNLNFYGSGWAKGEDVGAFVSELRATLPASAPKKWPTPREVAGQMESMGVTVKRAAKG